MPPRDFVKKHARLLALAILWSLFVLFAMGQDSPPEEDSYEFIPFALQASGSADYGGFSFSEAVAAFDLDFILDSLRDQKTWNAQDPVTFPNITYAWR